MLKLIKELCKNSLNFIVITYDDVVVLFTTTLIHQTQVGLYYKCTVELIAI